MLCTRTVLFSCSVLWVAALNPLQAVPTKPSYVTEVLDSLFKNGYDRRVRPGFGGPAVDVGVTMYALSLSLNDQEMTMVSNLYFRQGWTDERLSFIPRHGVEDVTGGLELASQIWTPNSFFPGASRASKHDVTTPNIFVKISSSGQILMSARISITTGCNMDLRPLPMDSHMCDLDIESYAYSSKDIRYKWGRGEESFGYNAGTLPPFLLRGYRLKTQHVHLTSGNYSRLQVNIGFVRSQMNYYLLHTYFPSILVVVLSWISFFFQWKAMAARMILTGVALLIMVLLSYSTTTVLPAVPTVTSIEIYLFVCFVMVFAVAMEYVILLLLARQCEDKSREDLDTACPTAEKKSIANDSEAPDFKTTLVAATRKLTSIRPESVDAVSRIAFPIVFACSTWFTGSRRRATKTGATSSRPNITKQRERQHPVTVEVF